MHVVVQLEVLVVAIDERRRIAERAVEPARGDLRKADVARIRRDALQADLAREVDAAILADLPACDAHPPEPQLVQQPTGRTMCVWLTPRFLAFVFRRAAEARHERLLQAAGAERLDLVRIERAEAREQLIA